MSKKDKIILGIILFVMLFCFGHFYLGYFKTPGKVMMVSLSSDGHYAITSHEGNFIILWNLTNKTETIISRRGNIYSPYFIKGHHEFIWEGLNNRVYVQNVHGKTFFKFSTFPVYGEVMSTDLKNYFASDVNWNLYKGYGKNRLQMKRGSVGFLGAGKLLNLTLSKNDRFLLTSGDAMWSDFEPLVKGKHVLDENGYLKTSFLKGVVLWEVSDGQPVYKLFGNDHDVFASFSPDGEYVVAGDELAWNLGWKTKTGKKFIAYYDPKGIIYSAKGKDYAYTKGFPKLPQDYFKEASSALDLIISIKFISQNYFLRFYVHNHYAVLFKVNDPTPVAYLDLGKHPWPSVNSFSRDQAIDTAPKVHLLVTGQQYYNGINVYRYDPATKILIKLYSIEL